MVQPLTIKNARVWDGKQAEVRDLYTSDVVLDKPALGALAVDLEDYTIFPGLINAHDHLELNHYPRTKFREVYNNAHEWGEDINVRLNESPFKELRAYPLADRLFIGGLKNLLCGATTVAHHNPLHKYLKWDDFPVNVLQRYGWSHSLHFDTQEDIRRSHRRTPKNISWFIHVAEGTDDVAAEEYQRLKQLGCISENTVLVHGVGLLPNDVDDAGQNVRGLVWCPSTNLFLLGKTICMSAWTFGGWRAAGVNVALGSDSRLTADGDLIDEIQAALGKCDAYCIYEALTIRAARVLGQSNIGHLNPNSRADFITFSAPQSRRDISLVVKGGVPQIGDPDVMAKFPHVETVSATLDSVPKAIHVDLARRILKCSLKEPGLEILEKPERQRVFGWI